MNRDLTKYIEINRHLMTSREMAEELDLPIGKICAVLNYNKWEAVSVADRIREYLMENPTADHKEVAEKFNRGVANVQVIAKQLKESGQAPVEKLKAGPTPKEPDEPVSDERRKELTKLAREIGYGVEPKAPGKRFKEAYTQSSSPFGIADQLRKIKTK